MATLQTDAPTLQERLREDVFYGEERMHKMRKHNPLHMEAADALDARDATIAALVEALDDTLNSPKGSIPQSADRFYDGTVGRFTVARAR
jgi:hypothetical protein